MRSEVKLISRIDRMARSEEFWTINLGLLLAEKITIWEVLNEESLDKASL